jgi:hypothetical protein
MDEIGTFVVDLHPPNLHQRHEALNCTFCCYIWCAIPDLFQTLRFSAKSGAL